jgi:tRNA(Ile)-lysidine synthase
MLKKSGKVPAADGGRYKTLLRRAARRSELAQKLWHHLQGREWTRPGQRIGVAVSGGADSVALLLLLLELREQLGIVLSVAHFNHKLRGRASDADEKFVTTLAARHGLPFFVAREDVGSKAKRERANLEDAARRSRYDFFERLVGENHVDRVAVAHTADDQAETVLSHILRGTGLSGLGGIHPESGIVFRPLLKFRRLELRTLLRAGRQTWREDATNRDTERMRARIRHKLVPLLEKQFQPAVVEHLSQLADRAREDDGHLNFSAKVRVSVLAKKVNGEMRISIKDLMGPGRNQKRARPEDEDLRELRTNQHAMTSRMIRLMVEDVKPRSGQLSSVHVAAILRLAQQSDSGKSLPLPGGVEVRRERDFLAFRPLSRNFAQNAAKSTVSGYAHALNLQTGQADVPLVEHSCCLQFRVIDWPPEGRETSVTGAVLDRDSLRSPLVVRNWRPGDMVQPLGHQKRHKLSRLLNEAGVSRWEKISWPVLTSGGSVVWTPGLPVAADFAAKASTRKGVVITEVSVA